MENENVPPVGDEADAAVRAVLEQTAKKDGTPPTNPPPPPLGNRATDDDDDGFLMPTPPQPPSNPPPPPPPPPPTGEVTITPEIIERAPEAIRPNLRALAQKVTTLETQLAEAKKAGGGVAQAEHDKILNELARVSLERDPRFIARYETAINGIKETLKETLVSVGEQAATADVLAAMPYPEAVKYAMTKIRGDATAAIMPLLQNLRGLTIQRTKELDAARNVIETERTAGATAFAQGLEAEIAKRVAAGETLLGDIPGNERWNKASAKLKSDIKAVQSGPVTPELATDAVMGRVYRKLYQALVKQMEVMGGGARVPVPGGAPFVPSGASPAFGKDGISPDDAVKVIIAAGGPG